MDVKEIAKTIVESGTEAGIEFTQIKEAEFKYSLNEGFLVFFTFRADGKSAIALANNTEHPSFAAYERGEYKLANAWKIKVEDGPRVKMVIEATGKFFNGKEAEEDLEVEEASDEMVDSYKMQMALMAEVLGIPVTVFTAMIIKAGLSRFKALVHEYDSPHKALAKLAEED